MSVAVGAAAVGSQGAARQVQEVAVAGVGVAVHLRGGVATLRRVVGTFETLQVLTVPRTAVFRGGCGRARGRLESLRGPLDLHAGGARALQVDNGVGVDALLVVGDDADQPVGRLPAVFELNLKGVLAALGVFGLEVHQADDLGAHAEAGIAELLAALVGEDGVGAGPAVCGVVFKIVEGRVDVAGELGAHFGGCDGFRRHGCRAGSTERREEVNFGRRCVDVGWYGVNGGGGRGLYSV